MGDVRTCSGCGAQTAMWACEGCGAGHPIDALDVTMRCAACRAKGGLPPTEAQAGYAPVAVPPAALDAAERNPDIVRKLEEHHERLIAFLKKRLLPPRPLSLPPPDYASIKKSTDSSGFLYPERLLIERYVRAAVAIPGTKGRIDGTIEIGLHYERGERPSPYRAKLIEAGEVAVRMLDGRSLDEDTADEITEDLNARIVHLWGDRPRFIEIWRGTGDDAEPLSQVYAPHGMPIRRPRVGVLSSIRAMLGDRPSGEMLGAALVALLEELGATP